MAFTNAQRQARWRAARRAELLVLRKIVAAAGLHNPNAPIAAKQTRKATRQAGWAQHR
ncbi:MAG: hypothetical protein WAO08_38185 [Hyphomicrobiaceae bacterium]